MQPPDLPRLDGVVLSHLQGDHFDRVAKKALHHDLPVVTSPHAERRLRRWEGGMVPRRALRITKSPIVLRLTPNGG